MAHHQHVTVKESYPDTGFSYVRGAYYWQGQDPDRSARDTGYVTDDPVEQPHLDTRAELREFLRSRRDRLQPADIGVPAYGRRRRVRGLRREEVAQAAGVSVAYYTRLEQGNAHGASAEVLDAIARALRLNDSERAHLFHLAKPQRERRRAAPARPQQARPALAQLLEVLEDVPAYVWGRRTDILTWNRAAAAVFGGWIDRPAPERNWARIVFLDESARDFFLDWETKAAEVVGQLQLDAGMHGEDPRLAALVGELSIKSPDFLRLWSAHNVKRHSHGRLPIRHPRAGDLLLSYETLALPEDQDQALTIYHAEPGPDLESLRFLVRAPGPRS